MAFYNTFFDAKGIFDKNTQLTPKNIAVRATSLKACNKIPLKLAPKRPPSPITIPSLRFKFFFYN